MNKKIVLFSMAAAIALPLSPVLAQSDVTANVQTSTNSTTNSSKEQRVELRQNMMQNRQQIKTDKQQLNQDRCKNVETRISNRVNNFENNQAMFQTVFGNMKARLERLTARLDTAGADTSKLKTDIATINGKIDKLNTDYATFVDGLKQTQTLACGQSQGDFVTKLGDARKNLPLIQQDRSDIRNFFQATIKPDLLAIRQKLADQKATTTGTSDNITK
jgi:chromosome segregation ATPase